LSIGTWFLPLDPVLQQVRRKKEERRELFLFRNIS
jgi:hypothetical protein